jgi:CheY-like chemotaxis protein
MGKSLLLADDSVTIQKVVGLSFASEDIQITTVDNGDDAVTRAKEIRPDVILADVVMPGMSGYEVCEAIKADAELRHIPVLLLTGTFEAFDDARAAQVGAAGHVAKPFEAQTLVERVKELLANAPAPEPVAETPPPTFVETAPTPAPDATVSIDAAMAPPPVAEAPRAEPASFDFFDEPATPESPAASTSEAPAPEGAFSFGTDDLEPASNTGPPGPAAHTVAILPDDIEDADPMLPPVPSSAALDSVPPVPPSAEGFDFEFESVRSPAQEAPIEPPAPTQIAEASLLDPAGDSAFDVSSSDLGDLEFEAPTAPPPPAALTQLIDPQEMLTPEPTPAPRREGIASLDADPVMQLLSSPQLPDDAAELAAATPEADPFAAPEPPGTALDSGFAMPEPALDATPEPEPEPFPMPEPELDAVAPAPDEPLAPEAEPAWPAEPLDDERMADAQLVADEAIAEAEALPDAEALITQITPVLREQLHETLEKIAWESFGQVTETIVEHAVERLEKAAWEVVPKLAETLILEEIRKLKGE